MSSHLVLASITTTIWSFYAAMLLMGAGYSFAGNVPSVYLITGWFGRMSARVIGFYFWISKMEVY